MKRNHILGKIIATLLCLMMITPSLADVLTLPSGTKVIEEYAFYGDTSLDEVVLPEGIEEIGEYAFAESGLKKINLPSSLSENTIADNAIDPGVEVDVTENTEAYTWALKHGYIEDGQPKASPTDFDYLDLGDGTCSIIDYHGDVAADIVIPSVSPEGLEVSQIGRWAFHQNSNLSGHLFIPNNIVKICEYAFAGCSGLCGDLIIPDSVTTIEESAFRDCSGFKGTLKISTNLTEIKESAFRGCSGFTGELIIPEGIVEIGSFAFCYCIGFTGDLILPEGLTTIRANAFSSCRGLKGDLFLPDSVTTIEDFAFYGSGFSGNLKLPANLTKISRYLFQNCYFQGSLTIPTGVTEIGDYAFGGCYRLSGNLTIPENVTKIGDQAFSGCYNFTGILKLPSSLLSIGEYAFSYCYGFNGNLIIPDNVTTLGRGAFSSCTGFNGNLSLSDSLTRIESSTFLGCTGLSGNLIIPDGVTLIGENAFSGCAGFTGDLRIPDTVIEISDCAFMDCTGFNGKLTLSAQLTSIGFKAFSGCNHFNGKLVLPDGLTTLGHHAFYTCSGFTGDLTIPSSVKEIGNNAFSFCTGFSGKLTICYGVETIQSSAFYGCSGFTGNLVIPNSVIALGGVAFTDCSGFNGRLVLSNMLTSIESYAFLNCSRLTGDLIIPDSVTTIEENAFGGCFGFKGNLLVSDTVESISDSAFTSSWGYTCLNGFENIYCVPGSYAWEWFSDPNKGLAEKLLEWDGITPLSQMLYKTVSGTVVIGSTPVESAYVYAFDADDEIKGMTITDRNGRWSMRLEKGKSYSLVYGLSGYRVASGTTSVTLTADTDVGTTVLEPDGVSDSTVSFTMTSDNLKVGTTIHFNISSSISNEVQLIVNDVPYEYIALDNGTRDYDRVFHLEGTRNIRFSAVDSDGVTHLSSIQTITLSSDGDLHNPKVHVVGDQYVGQGFTLTWDGDNRAAGYSVYVYGPHGLAWPASKYYTTEENTTPNTYIPIPGDKLLFDGDYTIDVIAFGNELNQATGSVAFTVYKTDVEATITYPYNGAKYVVGDTMHTTIAGGKGTMGLHLAVSYNDGADVIYDISESGKFEPKAEKVGKYKLTPYVESNDGIWTAVTDKAITVDVRAPRITDFKQGNYQSYAYKSQRSSFSFSGTIDENTSILISGAENDTIPAENGVTEFTWTSSVFNDVGIYTFKFTPVRNGVSGEPKLFPVVIMEDVTNTTKYTKNVLDVWSIPNGYVKDTLSRGTQVTETYICGEYSLIVWRKDNKDYEGFVLTNDLTTTYIPEDAERIINVVCMDSFPDYVKIGNKKVYGVITTNDIENVTAIQRNEEGTKIYLFDKSHSEEWEIESAAGVEYQRFTCEIPVEKVECYFITWEATDSMGNKYKYVNDEDTYIVGMQSYAQFADNTRVYSKARELKFLDPIGNASVTIENPSDYRITFYGETTYENHIAYCYQITDIINDKIFYGWLYKEDAEFSLSEKPTDEIHKRGIIIAAFMDDDSNGDFYQDSSNTSMGYATLIYQKAGITDITTVSGPSTDDEIGRKLEAIFSKCDYNDIIYITIIAHGAHDSNGIAMSPLTWSLNNGNAYYSWQLNDTIRRYAFQISEVHLIIDSCYAGTYEYDDYYDQPPVIDALLSTTGDEAGRFVKSLEGRILCLTFINSLYDYMTSKFNTKATLSQLCSETYNYEKYINANGSTWGMQNIANWIQRKEETKPTCFYGATGSEQNIFFDTTK